MWHIASVLGCNVPHSGGQVFEGPRLGGPPRGCCVVADQGHKGLQLPQVAAAAWDLGECKEEVGADDLKGGFGLAEQLADLWRRVAVANEAEEMCWAEERSRETRRRIRESQERTTLRRDFGGALSPLSFTRGGGGLDPCGVDVDDDESCQPAVINAQPTNTVCTCHVAAP